MDKRFTYYAFISYNAHDLRWGKRLQRKLEHYRMPTFLCSEHHWESRTPIRPVFFAPSDIQPGKKYEELKRRLDVSKNLIVICSPNSAQSEWVGKEIEYFHSIGRTENIHFFIIDGDPESEVIETRCFHPIIKQLGIPEILGVNIHEKIYRWPRLNRERAYIQLITKLLGVEFDTLWQRHKKLIAARAALLALSVMLIIGGFLWAWQKNQNFDLSLNLTEGSEHNSYLPDFQNAEISVYLENEIKQESIHSFNEEICISNIPPQYKDGLVRMTVKAQGYEPIDTMIHLTEALDISLKRNEDFALYCGRVLDEEGKALQGVKVAVMQHVTYTDAGGNFSLHIPLADQRASQDLKLSLSGYKDKEYRNLSPGENNFMMEK